MRPLLLAAGGDEEKVAVLATLQQGSAPPRHVSSERGWCDLDDIDGERVLGGLWLWLELGLGRTFGLLVVRLCERVGALWLAEGVGGLRFGEGVGHRGFGRPGILGGDRQHRNLLARRRLRRPVWGRHALVHSRNTRLPRFDIRWEWLGSCSTARRITKHIVERVVDGGYPGDDGGFVVDVGLADHGRGEWVELWGAPLR